MFGQPSFLLTRGALPVMIAALMLGGCGATDSPSAPATTGTQRSTIAPTRDQARLITPIPTVAGAAPTSPPAPATVAPAPPTSPPVAPAPDQPATQTWVRENFENQWDIEYPSDWTINKAGLHEGYLGLQGNYNAQSYGASFSYPIVAPAAYPAPAPASLEEWVAQKLGEIGFAPGAEPVITDLTVAGAPAKKVLFGAHGFVYIWKHGDKNPRLVSVGQPGSTVTTPQPDVEALLDQFVAGIR